MEAKLKLARVIAQHLGWKGSWGGWIHDTNGKPVCQGWRALTQKLERRGWIKDRGTPFQPHIDWREVPNPSWHG